MQRETELQRAQSWMGACLFPPPSLLKSQSKRWESCDSEGGYLCEGGALHVFHSLQVSGQLLGRLGGDGLLLVLGQLLYGGGVVPQVDLSPN